MDTLLSRLDTIDAIIDSDDTQNTVFQSLKNLQQLIDKHIETRPALKKLMINLDKHHIRPKAVQDDEFEFRKNAIFAEADKIALLIQDLKKLDSLERHFDLPMADLNLNHQRYVIEVKNLQLRYNYLLVRSINLLQNYLNLNENIQHWQKHHIS